MAGEDTTRWGKAAEWLSLAVFFMLRIQTDAVHDLHNYYYLSLFIIFSFGFNGDKTMADCELKHRICGQGSFFFFYEKPRLVWFINHHVCLTARFTVTCEFFRSASTDSSSFIFKIHLWISSVLPL